MLALPSAPGNAPKPPGVRALKLLHCTKCRESFPAVVSRDPDELLHPDWDVLAEQAGTVNADRYQEFFMAHMGHGLTTRSANAIKPQAVSTPKKSTNT